MAKVGDKFIIEIGEVFAAKGTYMAYGCEENEYEESLYRVKGFNSLVFDDNGLNKLEKYEPTHVAGPADGHDLPEFIYGMSSWEVEGDNFMVKVGEGNSFVEHMEG